MKRIYTLLFILFNIYLSAQSVDRYKQPIFKDYNIYKNLTYAQVASKNSISKAQYLALDFYEPATDEAIARPLVVLFPDGNYLSAKKEQSEMVDWCKTLTTYGYTCACVNYRQGYTSSFAKSIERAMYKGVQDGRAAVRFLKEYERTFRIDTSQIFLGGKYSGADIALHVAFLDLERERPKSTHQIDEFNELGCLDCTGNNFNQAVTINGVINFEGRIYNPSILKNNPSIKVLNYIHEDKNQTANADQADNLQSIYNTNFIHRFLSKNKFETSIHNYNDNTASTNEAYKRTMNAFLSQNLSNQSIKPIGDTEVCALSTSEITIPNHANPTNVEWFVNNGTIVASDNHTAKIIWNRGIGEAKVQIIETNKNGLRCEISEPLIITIYSQPIAEFDIEYISDNVIKIIDNSQYANLLMFNLGNYNQIQQKSNTSTFFTYKEEGEYLITQTAEGLCGVSTQQIPIRINIPLSFSSTKVENILSEIPSKLKQGEGFNFPLSKFKEVKTVSLQIFDTKKQKINDYIYDIATIDKTNLLMELESGIYYLIVKVDDAAIATKKIIVQ